MTDWFPIHDQEAFTEALERCILGEYGPSLDNLVEHARNTPSFRGRLRDVITMELTLEWHDCIKSGSRDMKLMIGFLTLIRRVPIDLLDDELCAWFDEYGRMLEDDKFFGRVIGNLALDAIFASNHTPDPVRTAWWRNLQSTEAWSAKLCELFP